MWHHKHDFFDYLFSPSFSRMPLMRMLSSLLRTSSLSVRNSCIWTLALTFWNVPLYAHPLSSLNVHCGISRIGKDRYRLIAIHLDYVVRGNRIMIPRLSEESVAIKSNLCPLNIHQTSAIFTGIHWSLILIAATCKYQSSSTSDFSAIHGWNWQYLHNWKGKVMQLKMLILLNGIFREFSAVQTDFEKHWCLWSILHWKKVNKGIS